LDFTKIYLSLRVPGEEMDDLVHYDTKYSKHIVVVCKGVYYRVDVYDAKNQQISARNLEEKVEWVIADANKCSSTMTDEEKSIAALTTLERNEWAIIRKEHFTTGVNDKARDLVERSIFNVWIVDESPQTLTERGKSVLHGDGKSIWFDKCFNILVFADGKCGLNCEHRLTIFLFVIYSHAFNTIHILLA